MTKERLVPVGYPDNGSLRDVIPDAQIPVVSGVGGAEESEFVNLAT